MAIDDVFGPPMGDGMGLPGVDQLLQADRPDVMPRDKPEPEERRKALVAAWSKRVKAARSHWKKAFDRMLEDEDFVFGKQWSKNADDRRYVANLTLRLVAQKTAFLYAKNPKAVARRRERLNATSWDESQTTLQQLMQTGMMAAQQMGGSPIAAMAGSAISGGMAQMPPGAMGAATEGVMGAMGSLLGGAGGLPGAGSTEPGLPPGMPGTGMAGPGAPPGGSDLGGIISGMGNSAGVPINPMLAQAAGSAIDIAMDAARVKRENEMLDKMGKTLELLYQYQVSEQTHPFKAMMKKVVRRAVVTGVGYVKLGFERVMDRRPDMERGIADASERLSTLERLAADAADEITDENDREAEQLRLLIEDMAQQTETIAREGLVFDYPLSTSIIPDTKCIDLKQWLAADWVAEEFILSTNEVEEIYGVDVRDHSTGYSRADIKGPDPVAMARQWSEGESGDGHGWGDKDEDWACVWEVYSRKDGLVYVVCDGYPEFLREPASPEIYNERFFPWYALTLNETENEKELFPPSDVRLINPMQMEYNRCREGLKEHRIAARPYTAVSAGMLDEEDFAKIENREANALVEINGLQPQQDIKSVLQAGSGPGVDPNLYEVGPVYEDVLRTTGIQEANLGGTSDATATQSQIAEGSRMTSMGSNIDDLNDLLTQLARNGGQILMREMAAETVKKIVGVGAMWPELSNQEIANEVLLEIEAGSMGRPNAAQEIANAQRIYPLLIQLPGMDPEFLAKDLLRRLDDRLDLTQAYKSMMPSIVAMNGMAQGAAGGAGLPAGAGQGPQGASNAPQPSSPAPGGPPDAAGQLAGAPPPGMSPAPRTLQ